MRIYQILTIHLNIIRKIRKYLHNSRTRTANRKSKDGLSETSLEHVRSFEPLIMTALVMKIVHLKHQMIAMISMEVIMKIKIKVPLALKILIFGSINNPCELENWNIKYQ